jgi:hypothetical protein
MSSWTNATYILIIIFDDFKGSFSELFADFPQSVTTEVPLKAGDELFTFYGYGPAAFPSDFLWYWETKAAIDREDRLQKEAKEKAERKQKKPKKKKGAKQ